MSKAVSTTDRQKSRMPAKDTSHKLLGRLAAKYEVDPGMLLATLRDTVFKPPKKDSTPFSDVELAAALILADKYDLNPFAKEIYVTRNRGALLVIVPIDGWSKIVNRHDTFDGAEFEYQDGDDGNPVSCTCRMFDSRRTHPIAVTEYYDECFAPKSDSNLDPWRKWPRRMLRHKAFIQAARICYSLGSIVDDDEAARAVEAAEFQVLDDAPERQPARSVPLDQGDAEPQPDPTGAGDADPKDLSWREWEEVREQLTKEQLAECRKAAGVDVINKSCSLDALNAALSTASEIVQGGRP